MICCNIHHNKYRVIRYNLYSYVFAAAYNQTKQIIHNIIPTAMTVYHYYLFKLQKQNKKQQYLYFQTQYTQMPISFDRMYEFTKFLNSLIDTILNSHMQVSTCWAHRLLLKKLYLFVSLRFV